MAIPLPLGQRVRNTKTNTEHVVTATYFGMYELDGQKGVFYSAKYLQRLPEH